MTVQTLVGVAEPADDPATVLKNLYEKWTPQTWEHLRKHVRRGRVSTFTWRRAWRDTHPQGK